MEVRLSELHDQALAVGQAHQKMAALEAAQADYRARAEKRIVELEASSRPPADIRDVSHSRLATLHTPLIKSCSRKLRRSPIVLFVHAVKNPSSSSTHTIFSTALFQ